MWPTSGRSSRSPARARARWWHSSPRIWTCPTRLSRSWRRPVPRLPASPGGCSASRSRANSPTSLPCRARTPSPSRRRGAPSGIRPYGLDALNTLRIEKGHVTSAELNGNTSAQDLGFERMLKKHGDFIGRTLSGRAALGARGRLQLVGVRPVEPTQRLRNGLQLVAPKARQLSLGYVTSSTPSVELEGWVGLALLAGGRQRIGERLTALSPVHDEATEVQIVSPHMLDAENQRVRA